MITEFHLHANHFEAEPPASLSELEDLGLVPKLAEIHGEGGASPLWLITRRFSDSQLRDEVADQVAGILKDDPSFTGYMETEVMPGRWACQLDGGMWVPSGEFPSVPMNAFNEVDKTADIHVFRAPETASDGLDNLLRSSGWYLVTTPTRRIWTLLMQNPFETNVLMGRLRVYFEQSGGVERLEGEMVRRIWTFHDGFKMPPVVQRGTVRG